ncbi:MAG: hypothetical protein DRO96_00250 [Candidatus Aenigmatarchaeota archaeon]|nr:MAG: hypothetical protein DRN08_02380 [Thermoplasmata archaeon]RLI97566.1 MAG: hypothetical protein DRO96_00250 [Candidatus Aenigmarchaeota archaeon]
MKKQKEISGLDIKFLVNELNFLVDSRIEKIYQDIHQGERNIRIRLYSRGFGEFELYASAGRFHLTNYRRVSETPSNFAMFLRKRLKNKRIKKITQHALDRIIELETDEYKLILELFHKGNFILTDSNYSIIMPFEIQRWSERTIAPKEKYAFPKTNSFLDDFREFKRSVYASPREIVGLLAQMGFGGKYAEEILLSCEVDKNKIAQSLSQEETKKVFESIKELMQKKLEPKIVLMDGKIIDAIPFDIKVYKNFEKKEMKSFNEAVDIFFSENEIREAELIKKTEINSTQEKKERIVKQQADAIKKWEEKEKEAKEKADIIYKNYGLVESILETLSKARETLSWDEIKKRVEKEDSPEANAIKEIREHDGIVVLELGGKNIEIDMRKSVEENAAELYEKAKKMKSKREKAKKIMEKTKEIKIEEKKLLVPKIIEKRKRKKWYEKYRYFWTSDGFLVVAGKDADTNEMLIKKNTKPEDIVLHAEIHGAPFTVVKAKEDPRIKTPKKITPVAVREAAEFAAAYSKAWQMGLGNVDVYWIKPEQVKKVPGLPKGSFQIQGERNYLKKTQLRLAIGVEPEKKLLMIAPVQAVNEKCKYFLTLKPGETPAKELAEKIKERLVAKAISEEEKEAIKKIPLDIIQNSIPSGKGSLVE